MCRDNRPARAFSAWLGKVVRYTHEYDALDRLTHSTLADGRSLCHVYDEADGKPQQAGGVASCGRC